jgi:putative membrane protein insertion efficiency factor
MISKLLIFIVGIYRRGISPYLPSCCKYRPSCSEYMIDAITEWGPVIGVLLGLYRLLRCNPFSKGGYDPVPKNKFKKKS